MPGARGGGCTPSGLPRSVLSHLAGSRNVPQTSDYADVDSRFCGTSFSISLGLKVGDRSTADIDLFDDALKDNQHLAFLLGRA